MALTLDNPKTHVRHYYKFRYPFRGIIESILGTPDLENLHTKEGAPSDVVKVGKDNHTIWHNKFYDSIAGSIFMTAYNRLLLDIKHEMLNGETLVVQDRPTFRIHWHNNLSVGEFHKDSKYDHPNTEINFWIPVTKAFDTNTIWIESEPDKGDYTPVNMEYGQMLIFMGGLLTHGNKINTTGQTRVSFDFRVIPFSKYVEPENPVASVAHGKKRIIGDYYRKV